MREPFNKEKTISEYDIDSWLSDWAIDNCFPTSCSNLRKLAQSLKTDLPIGQPSIRLADWILSALRNDTIATDIVLSQADYEYFLQNCMSHDEYTNFLKGCIFIKILEKTRSTCSIDELQNLMKKIEE